MAATGRYAAIGCKLKQNANKGYNSCASLAGLVLSFIVCFIACFILIVIASLLSRPRPKISDDDADDDADRRKRLPCNGRYVIVVELTVVDHDLVHVDWTKML